MTEHATVRDLIASYVPVGCATEVDEASELVSLRLDDLDRVSIAMTLEEAHPGIVITDCEALAWRFVGDVSATLRRKLELVEG